MKNATSSETSTGQVLDKYLTSTDKYWTNSCKNAATNREPNRQAKDDKGPIAMAHRVRERAAAYRG